MWTWTFWKDTIERTIYTIAEALLGYIVVGSGFAEIDWGTALSAAGVAGVVTVLKCIVVGATQK